MTLTDGPPAILNLHRAYFMSALKAVGKGSGFPLKHKYAPSILATCHAAVNAIWTMNTCYQWEPDLCLRISVLWQNCTSCTVSIMKFLSDLPDLNANASLSSHCACCSVGYPMDTCPHKSSLFLTMFSDFSVALLRAATLPRSCW